MADKPMNPITAFILLSLVGGIFWIGVGAIVRHVFGP